VIVPMKTASLASSPPCVALLGGLLLLLASSPASASPAYPALVKGYFKLSEAPACTLCHQTEAGGYATLNKSVGKYLGTTLGLVPKLAEADLNRILQQWGDRQDSDSDKAADIDELKAGTDPNDASDKPSGGGGAGGAGGAPGAAGAKAEEEGAGGSGEVIVGTGNEDADEPPANIGTQATCAVSAAPGTGHAGGWAGLAFGLGLAALVRTRRKP
jgi:MYXO-CTERM domain-containing protein